MSVLWNSRHAPAASLLPSRRPRHHLVGHNAPRCVRLSRAAVRCRCSLRHHAGMQRVPSGMRSRRGGAALTRRVRIVRNTSPFTASCAIVCVHPLGHTRPRWRGRAQRSPPDAPLSSPRMTSRLPPPPCDHAVRCCGHLAIHSPSPGHSQPVS